jgi:hypothetical protein
VRIFGPAANHSVTSGHGLCCFWLGLSSVAYAYTYRLPLGLPNSPLLQSVSTLVAVRYALHSTFREGLSLRHHKHWPVSLSAARLMEMVLRRQLAGSSKGRCLPSPSAGITTVRAHIHGPSRPVASVHWAGTGETLFERIVQRRLLIDSSHKSSNQLVCGVYL